MTGVELLFLCYRDLEALAMSPEEVMGAVEASLIEHGHKRVQMPPKGGLKPPRSAFINSMPAYLPELSACGIKWQSFYPLHPREGFTHSPGLVILNDPEDGMPCAILDALWITRMRTGAMAALSAKFLARSDCQVMGLIGAGGLARSCLKALKGVLGELKEVMVFSRTLASRETFCHEMEADLGIEATPVDSPREAAEGAELILSTTILNKEPILKEAWLSPGATALPLDHDKAWEADALLKADKFITDDWNQNQQFLAPEKFPGGLPALYAETGEIVAGLRPGRESPEERIFVMNTGIAVTDIALSRRAYQKAMELGVGTRLSLY